VRGLAQGHVRRLPRFDFLVLAADRERSSTPGSLASITSKPCQSPKPAHWFGTISEVLAERVFIYVTFWKNGTCAFLSRLPGTISCCLRPRLRFKGARRARFMLSQRSYFVPTKHNELGFAFSSIFSKAPDSWGVLASYDAETRWLN
jgi:hypothetical protein